METNPIKLPIGAWLPDLPDLDNQGSPNARNVFPRTSKSYGPVASPMVYSSALSARCQGAAALFDNSGNVNLFAGTTSKLYQLTAGGTTWSDVSIVAGYNVAATDFWNFQNMNGNVIAANIANPIQSFVLGSGTKFANLSASAPQAKYIAVVANFLVAANTFDGVNGNKIQRVWWSALNDPTNWPTPGTTAAIAVQSSFNDLLGDYGPITGIVGNLSNADGAVFMQKAVFRLVYQGPPGVFAFPPAEGVPGCIAPGSIVRYANMAFYLAADGFYQFDGASAVPIGADQVDRTFWADLDQSNVSRVQATVDPINRLIIWAYPGQGNSNGNPNHLLLYNWVLKRWAIADVTCELVASLLSLGYTLDQLFTVLGYSLDNLPAPLDSSIWTGGNILLGLFDTSHKLNFLTGSNLAPTVDTMEIQPFPGRRFRCTGARPLVDGGSPSVAIGKRERQQDGVSFTAAVAMNSLGICPVRTSGRYGRARITLPAGSVFTNIMGVELEGDKAGIR